MKTIEIESRGEIFTVMLDDEDYPVISRHKWNIIYTGSCNRPYAFTRLYNEDKKNGKTLLMHSMIMGNVRQHDHKDGNSLNNQKDNLRPATYSQNGANRSKSSKVGGKPTSSQYKGVSKIARTGKWRAVVSCNRKSYQCGEYETEDAAAVAYNEKATELFGVFAKLNQIGMVRLGL